MLLALIHARVRGHAARRSDRLRLLDEPARARHHRLPLHQPSTATEGTPDNLPRTPDVNLPGIKDDPVLRRHLRPAQPPHLARAADRAAPLGRCCSGRRPACGCARSARTRWRPRRRACRRCGSATARSPPRARWRRSAAPTCRSASSARSRENMTAGKGFIGARGDDLRPLDAAGRARRSRCCSASSPRSRSGCRCSRRRRATLFQALPYVITLIAVAGLVGRSIPPAADGRPLDR